MPANQDALLLLFRPEGHIHHLTHLPLLAMGGHHHRPQARIIESDGCGRGSMQPVQRHAVAPDGCPALHDDERATRDVGQRGERLGGGDGRGDGDGVDDCSGQFLCLPFKNDWCSNQATSFILSSTSPAAMGFARSLPSRKSLTILSISLEASGVR